MNILSRIPSPFSVEGAYLWLQVFSLLFLAATILTGAGTIITGFIANSRVAQTLAKQQERAANAEKELLKMKMPRWARLTPLDEALKGKPSGSVEIVFVPDNDEAHKTAMSLEGALSVSGGWKLLRNARPILPDDKDLILPQYATPEMAKNPFNLPLIARMGGSGDFTVIASEADVDDHGFPRVNTGANAVLFALIKCEFEPYHNTDSRLAAGNVRIIVGPRQ